MNNQNRYSTPSQPPTVDVLLTAINDSDVASPEWQRLIFQNISSVGAVVHEVEFGDDADGSRRPRVHFLRQLERVRVGQIRIGRRHGQNQAIVLGDKLRKDVSKDQFMDR